MPDARRLAAQVVGYDTPNGEWQNRASPWLGNERRPPAHPLFRL
ncbi:MAG: hypothetical protein SNJ67_09435 [Chloracidobacterium sp.]|nr:hypothetical protein [Chloracidobacterium validum]